MKKITAAICCLLAFVTFSCNNVKGKADGKKETKAAIPVYQTTKAVKEDLESSLRLPAQLMANQAVSIFPKVNGYVKNVWVDIGDHVHRGQVLMTLVAPEMEQASQEAKEKYARSMADYSISKEHYNRLLVASKTQGAISPLDLSATKAKMNADSSLSNAEKDNWQMERAMKDYLTVTAPFTGVITDRNVDPGSLVNNMSKDGKAMLELKQINELRLLVDIPEAISARLRDGDTLQFTVSALPGQFFEGRVSRRAMNIDSKYRVETIQADVSNKSEQLKPGMYADVIVHMNGNPNALVVPKSAVVTSTERKYVLVKKNNTLTKVDVTTGNESIDQIEIFGQVKPGDDVVVKANDEINEGPVN